jgi:NTE family protein
MHAGESESQLSGSSTTLASPADRGLCLCLSGGGFRATLFHLGVMIRLNELGVLPRLSTVSSVSGGSILNGVLATSWAKLKVGPDGTYKNLIEEVAEPVRSFCSKDLRTPVLLGTRLNPKKVGELIRDRYSVSANSLADGYEDLYKSRLSDLKAPGPGVPRFIFCATNVRTGACWHFHGGPQARMGDFYVGYCDAGHVRVSDAVAASSAFTPASVPFGSSCRLALNSHAKTSGALRGRSPRSAAPACSSPRMSRCF